MKTQKYSVNQHLIETILSWVKAGEIAIPEIQRPFVWNATKVRDLMDSLYQGYPIGYLIAWRNPNVKLKDGSTAEGRKILIDGQQRVTALTAAILGNFIINKDYRRTKIKISFHPLEEKFEVFNTAIAKNKAWIQDISPLASGEIGILQLIREYRSHNPTADENQLERTFGNLWQIKQKQIGLIELDSDLDIETVTEVFIRINSKGVVLSQADFAMSKIASNDTYGGSMLRKCIDYFCHMAVSPDFYNQIIDVDETFTQTAYFQKMSWLRNENDDLYDPDYTDLLRVAFTSEFNRGKLSDLVALLSGRNFETRTFEEEIAEQSFKRLEKGIIEFINESNFKRFLMIIKSAGFVDTKLIRSQNVLNFAYILYLKLKSLGYYSADIETYVRKWFVMSILTGRYSGSPETRFDSDIRSIATKKFGEYLESVEDAELSDAFWDVGLVQNFNSSVSTSPAFNVFIAAQVKLNNRGFLSQAITVKDLVTHRGDIHHVFPRNFLKKNGLKRGQYNQIANYVYMQSEININVGDKPPTQYFAELREQCANGTGLRYGGIADPNMLIENLRENCIPVSIFNMGLEDYEMFLQERRKLMADKIKCYYQTL